MNTLKSGTDVQDIDSLDEILKVSGLDWDIKLSPVRYGDFGDLVADGVYAAHRSDNDNFIDIYRTRKSVSNREALTLFDELLKAFDPNWRVDSIGELRGGRDIYMSCKMPQKLAPMECVGDVTDVSLLMTNSHLTGIGASVSLYYERLACTNGTVHPVKFRTSISHSTAFVQGCVDAFNLALKQIQTKQQIMDLLYSKKLPVHQAEDILVELFSKKSEEDDDDVEQPSIITDVLTMYEDTSMRGSEFIQSHTAYGLLNCLTEYYSHYSGYTSDKVFGNLLGVQPSQKWLKNIMKLEDRLVKQSVS